jgi:hypothetical protein
MSKIDYDIIAEVRFFTTEEGGRNSSTPKSFFGCPMIIGGAKYDCRLLLDEIGSIKPGGEATVPIKFLDTETVLAFLKNEDNFELWEMRTIAEGKVIDIKPK